MTRGLRAAIPALLLSGCAISHPPLQLRDVPGETSLTARAYADAANADVAAALYAKARTQMAADRADDRVATLTEAILVQQAAKGFAPDSPQARKAIADNAELAGARRLADTARGNAIAAGAYLPAAEARLQSATAAAAAAQGAAPRARTLDDILAEATRYQNIYADYHNRSARLADWAQLPLIGAAAYAAGVVLDKPKHATAIIGYTGIAAGVYSTTRAQIFPAGLPQLYAKGYSAMACVNDTGLGFVSEEAKKNHIDFLKRKKDLEDAWAVLENARAQIPATMQDALSVQIKLAEVAAGQAEAADDTAATQIAAYLSKETAFGTVVRLIVVAVVNKADVRNSPDFDAMRKLFYTEPAPSTETPVHAVSTAAPESDEAARGQALIVATADLMRLTKSLTRSSPNYVALITDLEKCPKTLD